jgi:DNA-directed RNA polymerase
MELTEALKFQVPALYPSNLPVHQDGTCNGLQHYAALGGDKTGAQHVNLERGDRPADVYSHVARMVDVVVDQDAAEGVPEAKVVQGKIARKVVKQTVSRSWTWLVSWADMVFGIGNDHRLWSHVHRGPRPNRKTT